MTTLRGLDGMMALGGYLIGSILVDGAVSALGTSVNFKSSGTLVGVSGPGDTFTVGANTYTVTSTWIVASTNTVVGVTFTPGAVGGFTDGAAVTYAVNSVANVRQWQATPTFAVLDTTVMRNYWDTCRTGRSHWTGEMDVLLDYDDPFQKILIDKILTNSPPLGTTAAILLNATYGLVRNFYGAAQLKQLQFSSSIENVVMVKAMFEGNGRLFALLA